MEDVAFEAASADIAAGKARGATAGPFSQAVDGMLAPYGILVLRVAIGIDWIAHALLKI